MTEQKNVIVSSERVNGKEFIQITDTDTGEVIDQYWHNRSNKPTHGYTGKKPDFFKVYRTNWLDIVLKKKLEIDEIGFLMAIMAFIDWESNFLVHPKTRKNLSCRNIADLLRIDKNYTLECMNKLNKKGLIAVVKFGDGYPNHYIVNTNVLFRGSKIKDMNEYNRFAQDCPYQPVVDVKYKQRDAQL